MAAGEEKRVRRKAPVAQAPLSSGKPEGDAVGSTLRPRRLEDFIGQEQLRRNLAIFIKAALSRKEPLDHCLLYGPPCRGTWCAVQVHERTGTHTGR
jgi:Holliday junction resolvasome RuvABC ATP-dependent DNA helicase subunit